MSSANPPVLVFEDNAFVVVNKPAHLHSHAIAKNPEPTLADWLNERYPEMRKVGYEERQAGLIHRLDAGTSGLLIAARTREAFLLLRDALSDRKIQKHYLALCTGHLAQEAITYPIANHPRNQKKSYACKHAGELRRLKPKDARTEITKVLHYLDYTLFEASAPSAHRHQIRVHLQAQGHPLVGDTLYGGESLQALSRQFLHAHRISFTHPLKKEEQLSLHSPLAEDLASTATALGFSMEQIKERFY